MSELLWCRIHDDAVTIPDGAVEIPTKTKTYKLWKFPDGSLHDLRKPTNTKTEAGHIRLHVKKHLKKRGCPWCQTPQVVPQPRTPQVEAVDDMPQSGQDELANIVLDTSKELPERDKESEPDQLTKVMGIGRTQMQAAFGRLRGSNRNE